MPESVIICSKCVTKLENESQTCPKCNDPVISKRIYTIGEPKVTYAAPINTSNNGDINKMNSVPYDAKQKTV
jgi:predicted amidophosphoribosyltransferase